MTGVAVLGCGLIGHKRVAAFPASWSLVSVYDPDGDRAAALAAVGSDVRRASSVDEAVGADGVDVVVVAAPHVELAPLSIAALDHNRDVLVEKPGAIDVDGARAIAARAADMGRVVAVGFNHRFHPALLEAKDIVESDRFGGVMYVRARYGHGGRLGYEKEWRADRTISGGGELIDQGIHLIDLSRFLAGDMSLAFGELRTAFWAMDVEDNAYLALRGANGAFAWLHASWTEWKNLFSLEVMLETAKIDISGLGGSYGTETLTLFEMLPEMGPPLVHRQEWPASDDSWQLELEAFERRRDGVPSQGAAIEDAVAALMIIDDAYREGTR